MGNILGRWGTRRFNVVLDMEVDMVKDMVEDLKKIMGTWQLTMVMDMQVDTVKGFGWRHSGELGWGPGGRRF